MTIFGGHVEPGYEKVREQFMGHFESDVEHCAQVCAYVRGRKVVDLWGAREHREKEGEALHGYGPDGLQNVFSSSKVLTSLVVAMMVDRGHLSYDQKISDIWPEYAQNGKGNTTVAMLMRHEAGLSKFDVPMEANNISAERIRDGAVCDIIARQKPGHEPGASREYHGMTRGWIINEVVRRADPHGRTVGQFIRDEIAAPLGVSNELFIGLPDEHHGRVAPLHTRGRLWALREYLRPSPNAAGIDNWKVRVGMTTFESVMWLMEAVGLNKNKSLTVNGSSKHAYGTKRPDDMLMMFNMPEVRRSEIPSANGHASARALAVVAAALAERGTLPVGCDERCPQGHTLLSKQGFEKATGDLDTKKMFGFAMAFSNAGWYDFGKGREGFMGWMGLGGSVLQWQPEDRIGFGYAMNLLEPIPWNARALNLQRMVRECAKTAPDPAPNIRL